MVHPGEVPQLSNDIPETVIDADSNNPASIALALTALVARPTFGETKFLILKILLFFVILDST